MSRVVVERFKAFVHNVNNPICFNPLTVEWLLNSNNLNLTLVHSDLKAAQSNSHQLIKFSPFRDSRFVTKPYLLWPVSLVSRKFLKYKF